MRLPLLLVLLATALPAAPVRAAEAYDNCTGFVDTLPAVITTQGTWCLRQDVSTAIDTGAAIVIAANNVTLDCNDFKIGGLAAGAGTTTTGVEASSRANTTVRNCTIRGFYRGLRFLGLGSGQLVEHNRFEGNTFTGVQIRATNYKVRDNLVLDTGGSSLTTTLAYGIYATGDAVQVLDNTVNGVAAGSVASGSTIGIYYDGEGNGDADIGGNWVQGVTSDTEGSVIGIAAVAARAIIHDNRLQAPVGVADNTGVRCVAGSSLARANMLIGFTNALVDCTISGNVVVAP